MLNIIAHVNKIFSSISYVLRDEDLKHCWIIDVGDSDAIRDIIKGYELKGVLLTHSHYDHVYGLNDLCESEYVLYTNSYGHKLLYDSQNNLSDYHGSPFIYRRKDNVVTVLDRDFINLGYDHKALAIFTPGHNPSCISWIIQDSIFTGDSYIPGIKTVVKLPGGNKEQSIASEILIKNLSVDKKIYPGHKI